jgi:hypothetical protein
LFDGRCAERGRHGRCGPTWWTAGRRICLFLGWRFRTSEDSLESSPYTSSRSPRPHFRRPSSIHFLPSLIRLLNRDAHNDDARYDLLPPLRGARCAGLDGGAAREGGCFWGRHGEYDGRSGRRRSIGLGPEGRTGFREWVTGDLHEHRRRVVRASGTTVDSIERRLPRFPQMNKKGPLMYEMRRRPRWKEGTSAQRKNQRMDDEMCLILELVVKENERDAVRILVSCEKMIC